MRWLVGIGCVLIIGCSYEEETREVGFKGKARINPYLAAERFLERYDFEVVRDPGWPSLDSEMSMAVMPASALSARAFVNDVSNWVEQGGHAVIALNGAEYHLNDWAKVRGHGFREKQEMPEALVAWLQTLDFGIESLKEDTKAMAKLGEVRLLDRELAIEMEGDLVPNLNGEKKKLVTREHGDGRITLMADARPLRNRWIGDADHAELLLALEDLSPYYGGTVFVRNVSLSFWKLVWGRGWPALTALLLLIALWLWKSLPRDGPLDSRVTLTDLRGYDHHLEALGEFHWRLDKAEGLLRPLRASILERAHRLLLTAGHLNGDVFALMADRAGITRERAERAMTHVRAKDAGSFTRLVADLQSIHRSIS